MQKHGVTFGELFAYLTGADPNELQAALQEIQTLFERQKAYEQAIEEAIAQLGGTIDTWGDMYTEEVLELARLSREYGLTVRRKPRSKRGRPRALSPDGEEEAVNRALAGKASKQTVAELIGVSRSTLWRRLKDAAEKP